MLCLCLFCWKVLMKRKYKKLLAQLESDDAKTRYEAVLALGKTGETEFIDHLDKVATLDKNPKVRDLANKAVRTLKVLRQREIEQERQALLEAEPEEPDDFNWPTLAKEDIMSNREVGGAGGKAEFDYVRAKQIEQEVKAREAEEARIRAEIEARQAKKDLRRKRRPRRILIFLVITLAIIGLVYVISLQLADDDVAVPDDPEQVILDMRDFVGAERDAATSYSALMANPIDCNAINAIELPDKPEWITADAELPEEATEHINDPTNILDNIVTNSERLSEFVSSITTACEGQDMLPTSEWADFSTQGGIPINVSNRHSTTYTTLDNALASYLQALLTAENEADAE